MPLLILFALAGQPVHSVLTGETVAEELVRTLVGSIGLVASVPITTGLAALIVTRKHAETRAGSATGPSRWWEMLRRGVQSPARHRRPPRSRPAGAPKPVPQSALEPDHDPEEQTPPRVWQPPKAEREFWDG